MYINIIDYYTHTQIYIYIYIHIHIYIYIYMHVCFILADRRNGSNTSASARGAVLLVATDSPSVVQELVQVCLGFYKIFVYIKAFVHERIIPFLPLPICIAHTIAILLHGYCAIYDPPPSYPFVCYTPYKSGIGNIL